MGIGLLSASDPWGGGEFPQEGSPGTRQSYASRTADTATRPAMP
jgi:hypothetical protein